MKTGSRIIKRVVPLRLRNSMRLALRRHPIEHRSWWPDLSMFDLAKKDVVFDVGAHIGEFTECVLAYQPWATVHAFEPTREAFQDLQRRFKENDGVHCKNFAFGSESGHQAINVSNYLQASSFLEPAHLLNDRVEGIDFTTVKTEVVRVKTVAAYARLCGIRRIKLLKLDVQGYELEVLKGAEPVLNRIEFIHTEAQFQELYKDGPLFDEVFQFLSKRGFELERMTSFRTDNDGALMVCDMVFRNRTPGGEVAR